MLNRPQTIIWTIDGIAYLWIYVSHDLVDENGSRELHSQCLCQIYFLYIGHFIVLSANSDGADVYHIIDILTNRDDLLLFRGCDIILLVLVRFWGTGHGRVARTLGIIAGDGLALRVWGPRSKLTTSTWSNSFITCICPASARRQILVTYTCACISELCH